MENKDRKIRLSKSVVGKLEKAALGRVIDEEYLGAGIFVQEFEKELKNYLGAANVVCVNTGTASLHLALMAAGLRPQDEVLVQSLTYVACFQAITASGAIPVACDVDIRTCTIDLNDAEKRLTEKTRAIMPVHYASRPGDLNGVYKFAKSHNLRVIEDAAHSFGGTYKGKKIGSFGDIVCFSFDGIKNITCGEGGAVVTSDEKVASFVRDARLLGVSNDTEKRYQGQRSWVFDVTHQGYRYHMSNLFAAIGIEQLRRLEIEFIPKRRELARRYYEAIQGISGIELFPNDYKEIVPHIFPIRVLNGKRDRLRQCLTQNNIECGVHYFPNHRLSFFCGRKIELPVTDKLYAELLSIPLHPDIDKNDQDQIISCITNFMESDHE